MYVPSTQWEHWTSLHTGGPALNPFRSGVWEVEARNLRS